ncbi:expressed unknown protein [Seminavis robusta]|uniref:Uncharacterized protein n=1 Tax=Seminavis robusta TaxID=568900 RepID=A0A9N8EDS8_9STRA|nr:expressed unknown protein [Seminavis robusta]|eukprot:Sro795_g203630.1 n/a (564) ;mRNA; r:46413-48104
MLLVVGFWVQYLWMRQVPYHFAWVETSHNKASSTIFSMGNSPHCKTFLSNPTFLPQVAHVAVQDWMDRQHKTSNNATTSMSPAMQQASAQWNQAMRACHYYHDTHEEQAALSLRSFMDGLAKCGDPHNIHHGGLESLFEGEWCSEAWRKRLRPAFWIPLPRVFQKQWIAQKLVQTARCALHLEFPLQPCYDNNHKSTLAQATAADTTTTTTNNNTHTQKVNNNPKQVFLVALAMGRGQRPDKMACPLVATAVARNWNVVLATGRFRGLKYKYTYALQTIHHILAHTQSHANETLIVFADAKDVFIQNTPSEVLQAFQTRQTQQSPSFLFSAEDLCFPMGVWPHSLGIPHSVCGSHKQQGNFPMAMSQDGAIRQGHKFVNTGGWLGVASQAGLVLQELSHAILNRPEEQVCHTAGTDQLLGNAAFLRHSSSTSTIGLDANYQFFAGGSWSMIHNELQLQDQPESSSQQQHSNRKAYCHTTTAASGASSIKCPPFLHFNGGNTGGVLQEAYEALTSPESLPSCGGGGSLTTVNLDTNEIQVWQHEDFMKDSSWRSCLKGKACFGG